VDAALHFKPQRNSLDIEDDVAKFVENELGRHDWAANWPAWKVKHPNYRDKIRKFFWRLGDDIDPDEIVRHIDSMILTRPGRWR
jgi:hypothetical protein